MVAQRVEHQAHNLGVAGSTPVHNTLRSAETDCSGTLKTSQPLGPRGTGGRVGRPSFWLERPRDATAGRVRREPDALKHADSAALRRRQGDADVAHVVRFRPMRAPAEADLTRWPGGSSGAPRPEA